MRPFTFVISQTQEGERLDRVLRPHLPAYSRAGVLELIDQGLVRLDGRKASKGSHVREGQRVQVLELVGTQAQAPAPALQVLYEDAVLIAVDKPAHVPSHALRAHETYTLANALLARYPEMADVGHSALEPGILHRLDTQTSGVLLAARTPEAFAKLSQAHASGGLDKQYVALCQGRVRAPAQVRGYLAADRRKVRVQTAPFEGGKPVELAVLHSEPVCELSLVTVRVSFAARHQVRAQLAALGHPIAGDGLYEGPSVRGLSRHFLHASEVTLQHPTSGETLRITAPLPEELLCTLAAVGS